MRKWRDTARQSTWRTLLALLSCATVLAPVLAGCGSSGKQGSTAKPTGASQGGSSNESTSKVKEGLQTDGKINYAHPPANSPVKSGLVTIHYHEIAIEPDTLKVKAGSTIEWVNEDPVEHNVTSATGPAKIASKNFGEGGKFRFTVTKPGVIHYRCTLHPATMNGTIEVVK